MRDRLIEFLKKSPILEDLYSQNEERIIQRTADYLLANGVVVLLNGEIDALYSAVNALADMVDQFGYSTTFRRKDAVCDGGLSALENAFSALYDCGFRFNSNNTINRENLRNYNIEEATKKLLKGDTENEER